MSYAQIAASFAREPFYFIEIQIGASITRCCTARDLIPVGLDAIPCLDGAPQTSAAEADPSGGPGLRASVSVTLSDFADQTATGANFWPRWRALNPYYEGARLSVFSGFVEGDTYDAANFQRRDYVIERFAIRRGKVTITGKDPLKLAANNRAQYPAASKGTLLAALAIGGTSATLQPAGIGSSYPASGFVRIRAEVMAYTRSGDVLTLTRAQYNTAAAAYSAGDSVQLCAVINDSAPNIVRTLLLAAGISSSYIPITEWQSEAAVYLPGLYETILTEPVGVTTLLKELGEQAPHLLYWNDKANRIEFVAVKAPPSNARAVTWSDHIVADSFDVEDVPDQRVTRVFVYFGQFDPTKKLDEASNYRQTFVRVDPTAESNYGGPSIKVIYSRWISTVNKAAAIRLAARIGRRFFNTPRRVRFAMDLKDFDVWTGTPIKLSHPLIADTAGNPAPTDFQVLSAAERPGVINYSALEFLYGPTVPEDADADATGKLVVISGELQNLNLRAVFNSIYPSVDPADDVRFIFDAAAVVGSSSTASSSVLSGTWPELTTPPLLDVRGLILGAGGKGADAPDGTPGNGGVALELQNAIRLSNSGTIGGGGGGGAPAQEGPARAAGGGGAGYTPGAAGVNTNGTAAEPGQRLTGGAGGSSYVEGVEPASAEGGRGGDIGQPGTISSGSLVVGLAGLAIKRNGYSITYTGAGAGNTPGGVS